jgi:hypothetical protein
MKEERSVPFNYEIFQDKSRALVVGEGIVGISECLQVMTGLAGDKGFDPVYDVIVDLRSFKYSPSFRDAESIASKLSTMKEIYKGKVAVVVSSSFLFGMARMASLLADLTGFSFYAFRDYEKAFKWIETGEVEEGDEYT